MSKSELSAVSKSALSAVSNIDWLKINELMKVKGNTLKAAELLRVEPKKSPVKYWEAYDAAVPKRSQTINLMWFRNNRSILSVVHKYGYHKKFDTIPITLLRRCLNSDMEGDIDQLIFNVTSSPHKLVKREYKPKVTDTRIEALVKAMRTAVAQERADVKRQVEGLKEREAYLEGKLAAFDDLLETKNKERVTEDGLIKVL